MERHSLAYIGPAIVIGRLVSSTAFWVLENGTNHDLRTFADALFWSVSTALTLGVGYISPVTAEGRVLAGFLGFIGLGLVTFVSAQFSYRLLNWGEVVVHEKLRTIEGELRAIRELLDRPFTDAPPRKRIFPAIQGSRVLTWRWLPPSV